MTKEEILKMTPEEHIDKAIQYAELNTPDTEWEKKLFRLASLVGTDAKNPKEKLLAYVQEAISSRDTHWKERVEKEVEKLNGVDGYESIVRRGDVLQALDNLK